MLCRHIWAGDAGSFYFPASTVAGDPLVLEKWEGKSPTHARMEAKSIFGYARSGTAGMGFVPGKPTAGVQYESLDAYRAQAHTVALFLSGKTTITMRRAAVASGAIEASR